jgi:hypothetical protein
VNDDGNFLYITAMFSYTFSSPNKSGAPWTVIYYGIRLALYLSLIAILINQSFLGSPRGSYLRNNANTMWALTTTVDCSIYSSPVAMVHSDLLSRSLTLPPSL